MSYSSNPLLPKARKWAIELVIKDGLPMTVAARKAGVHRTTLWRWLKRWHELNAHVQLANHNRPSRTASAKISQFRLASCKWLIPTYSSRPHSSPNALPQAVIDRIVYWRAQADRCAGVVHAHCLREGIKVSLASVKRVLKRLDLLRPVSKWKRYRKPVPRPLATAPGELVQTDTIHLVDSLTGHRVYLYTLIDIYSRWAYSEYHQSINQKLSLGFLTRAQAAAGFKFRCVQSDNGPEYGHWLSDSLASQGIVLRHSRVRKPNDNAHIERFNRTIQEEGLARVFPKPETVGLQLEAYLVYYNAERLHSSLQYRTPLEMLQRC